MTFHLRLTNTRAVTISLVLEPWGDVRAMPPGATVEIAFDATGDEGVDAPEIAWDERGVTVYAGRGGSFSLLEVNVPALNGALQSQGAARAPG